MIRLTSVRLAVLALVAAMMAAQCAPVSATQVPAFEMTGYAFGPITGGAAGVGYEFSTSTALGVYALGTFDHLGTNLGSLGGSVTVEIFTETSPGVLGSSVATASVSASDSPTSLTGGAYTPGTDAFRYDTSAPFNLAAGNYVILSSLAGTQDWFAQASGVTIASGVTFGNSVYNPSVFGSSPVTINPANLIADFGPNFLVGPVVPEPSTFVLGALAAMGLLCVARRRRRKCNA